MDESLKDERFAHITKDPRFRSIPKSERKVKIDRRFRSMFTDKRFKLKYTMDKRGRPVQHTTSEDLKKFYELSSSCSDEEEEEEDSGVEATPSDQEQQSDKLSDHAEHNKDAKRENRSKVHAGKVRTATRALKHCSVSDENRDARDSGQSDSSHLTNHRIDISLLKKKQNLKSKLRKGGSLDLSPRLSNTLRHAESSSECSDNEENDASEDENKMEMSFDPARGIGNVESSTTDDSTSESEDDEDFDHKWGELDADAPKGEEVTRRLAVCNMDWDRIKAQDLFVLLNSFKPPEAIVHSVTIYPSEYGLGRIKEEEAKGPPELVEKTLASGDEEEEEEENEEGSLYLREKLRQYQLNRLKYYYAVVECDSPETANKLYEELDGMEYEASGTTFDLRFIPDDMSFDQEAISIANSLPDMTSYKPKLFTTTALQQAKVDLTWDETNPDRIETLHQAFSNAELAEMDLKAYLASSSSDEEEEKSKVTAKASEDCSTVEDQISKYRSLLLSIEEEEKKKKEKDVEMEITWEPGLKDAAEELVKKKQKESQTPFEEFLEKRKEKRKKKKKERQKHEQTEPSVEEDQPFSDDDIPSDVDLNDPYFKEELESSDSKKKTKVKRQKVEEAKDPQAEAELQLLMMDDDDGKQHFNMKDLVEDEKAKSKRKRKRLAKEKESKPVDTFEVNVKDPRFTALFTSPLYNIDPSDPNFKKTKGMTALVQEKQKRRAEPMQEDDGPSAAKISRPQLAMTDSKQSLIKSVKMKTQQSFQKKMSKQKKT